MAAEPREDPQLGFEEIAILDQELENWCGDYFELVDQHRGWLKAKTKIKAAMDSRPEGRYRVGAYVLEVKTRSGGGISIPSWTSKVISVRFQEAVP